MLKVQQASLRLAERTGAEIAALWRRVPTTLTVHQFAALAAARIAQANARGVSLADLFVTAELIRLTGQGVPLGLRPDAVQVDQRRIASSLRQAIEADPGIATTPAELAESRRSRLSKFAHDEPLVTVSMATASAMVARPQITGWVRVLDADPCPKCIGWADGIVRPPGTRMRRHHGCGCIQQPVTTAPGEQAARPAAQEREWTDWADSPIGQLISGIV